MRIAIATPILFDENSPFNHLFRDIIGGFLDSGYEVVRYVACRDENEEAFKFGFRENICYIKYKRNTSEHSNIFSRYIRDTLTNMREAYGLRTSEADVLFEDVSYSSMWPIRVAKKKGMRIVIMLQDVWPDNAVQSGLLRENGLLYKYFECCQRYVYNKADRIICISDDMKDFIVSKGIEERKIEVIYNWGYSDEVVKIPWDENLFAKKYKLEASKFYVVYAGNIGKMQNVEIIADAARKMQNDRTIEFLIIGDGSRRKAIEERVKDLSNVRMIPLQSSEIATHIYSAADVNIIPLVEGGAKTAMPSKTGIILSCGKPVIFCFGSDTRFSRIIKDYGVGASVSSTDTVELVNEIQKIKRLKMKEDTIQGSYELFKDKFLRTKNISKYVLAMK